jgi:D-psicose/D-tagatose/L-ribulose 3-epimerase
LVQPRGAFGPNRDLTSDDESVQKAGLSYLHRCIDFAQALDSPYVSGPMYAAVGNTRLVDEDARRAQWRRSAANLKVAAAYAAERSVKLAIEPLNRFETDLINAVDLGAANCRRNCRRQCRPSARYLPREKDIPAAIRRAAARVVEFHACSNDRGMPGEDHLPSRRSLELCATSVTMACHDRGLHAGSPRDRPSGVYLPAASEKPRLSWEGRPQ